MTTIAIGSRSSSNSSLPRKRSIREVHSDEGCRVETGDKGDNDRLPKITIQSLALEAIFLPKFENENRAHQEVRRSMKAKIETGEGYLEVSLKHSGNLLLWSGGQRYYSKNSTDNVFTYVGEVLLRQHFYRSWYKQNHNQSTIDGAESSGSNATGSVSSGTNSCNITKESAHQECSDYVERNRLTLAFEAVTSVLGHHGDLPNKDFLVLTAVADRGSERFFSTVELLELAHRFRLPHNDTWVYSSLSSANELFHLYDTTRETALADNTIAALKKSADSHVPSMYPHVQFQGNILEGIVIRYVPYIGKKQQQHLRLQSLEAASKKICALVPAEMAQCYELVLNNTTEQHNDHHTKLLSVNIRKIYNNCIEQGGYDALNQRYSDSLRKFLEADHEGPTFDRLSSSSRHQHRRTYKQSQKSWNIPIIANSLLTKKNGVVCIDKETQRIATLIQKIDLMNAVVKYNVYRENDQRWLCTVHVLHDKTFINYQKKLNREQDMELFRGFTIELRPGKEKMDIDDDNDNPRRTMDDIKMIKLCNDNENDNSNNSGNNLMLKMKMLPYMVRTFCCRNGLRMINQDGPDVFLGYTAKMMISWGISEEMQTKWAPFFAAWGKYVHEYNIGIKRDYYEKCSSDSKKLSLPPLAEDFYLIHLNNFILLYNSGKIKGVEQESSMEAPKRAQLQGMVIVVAIYKEMAKSLVGYLSKEFGNSVAIKGDVNSLSQEDFFQIKAGRGLVVYASIEEGFGKIRKLVQKQKCHSDVCVLFYGCSNDMIEASLSTSNSNLQKKLKGIMKGWEKVKVGLMQHVVVTQQEKELLLSVDSTPSSLPYEPSPQVLESIVSNLNEWLQQKTPDKDSRKTRRGILLFFPCIPGCGKSTLCNSEFQASAKKVLQLDKDNDSVRCRKLIVLMGDQIKNQKYWPHVKERIFESPSSIFIADKNTPVSAWQTVGRTAVEGNGGSNVSSPPPLIVPILPDNLAMSTTIIEGVRKPANGELIDASNHRKHCYPFSLYYLAVCIARVLDRPKRSHVGGLDPSLPHCALVVIKFMALYRGVSAKDFIHTIRSNISRNLQDSSGGTATVSNKPIEVPFFARSSSPSTTSEEKGGNNDNDEGGNSNHDNLSSDLKEVLVSALQLQYGCDIEKKDVDKLMKSTSLESSENDDSLSAAVVVRKMEAKLREVINIHKESLFRQTVSEDISRTAFLDQISSLMKVLDDADEKNTSNSNSKAEQQCNAEREKEMISSNKIKLVAVDISLQEIREILSQAMKVQPEIKEILTQMFLQQQEESTNEGESNCGEQSVIGNSSSSNINTEKVEEDWNEANGFIQETHVTVHHSSQVSQHEMESTYTPLIGKSISINVTALLVNTARVAALVVEVPEETSEGDKVPYRSLCSNNFMHVTLWKNNHNGAESKESNDLPTMVETGIASKLSFEKPFTVKGVLSFWRE